jgi:hypothetical protein
MAYAMIEVRPIFSAEYSHGPYCLCSLVYSVVCTLTLRNQRHVVDETCPPHRSSTICGRLDKVLSSIANYDEQSPCCPLLPPSQLGIDHPHLGQSYSENMPLSGDYSPKDYLFSMHVFNPSIRLPDTDCPISRARQYVLPSCKNLTDSTSHPFSVSS